MLRKMLSLSKLVQLKLTEEEQKEIKAGLTHYELAKMAMAICEDFCSLSNDKTNATLRGEYKFFDTVY